MCYNADGYLVNMLQPHQQDIRSTTRRVFGVCGGGYLLNDSLQVCLFVVCVCVHERERSSLMAFWCPQGVIGRRLLNCARCRSISFTM